MERSWKFLIAIVLLLQSCDEKEVTSAVQVSADFSVSHAAIKVGESVTFTDLSEGDPNSWNWTFDGGEPSMSSDQNPVIKYTSPGSYKVSLRASNGSSEDTETKEGYIFVEAPIGSFDLRNEITFGLSIRTDFMQSMITLEDNSFISVGWTDNENTQAQKTNILVTKFDKDLNLIWSKLIGGSNSDLVRDVIQTNDGGFLLSASSDSNDGNISNNKGLSDILIVKLNADGIIEWTKTYGGSEYDGVNKSSLIKLENGYSIIGFTESNDADIDGNAGLSDIWLMEIDNNGNIVNSFTIGSTQNDSPYSFVKSPSGYVILSKIGAATTDFNKPGIWIFEVNSDGDISWKTFIDGRNAGKLIATQDGGYATINTNSNNISDLFVTKLTNQGGIQWTKSYPLSGQEFAEDIIQIDNEYLILGSSEALGSVPRNGNAYVAKLNETGNVIQTIMFGNNKISASRIFKIDDQTYILGGTKNIGQSYIDPEFWLQFLSNSN